MPSCLRIATACASAAVIAVSAAACGSAGSGGTATAKASASPLAGLTADQIVQKAFKDLAAASSVRINGTVPSQDGNIAIDITDVAPASCTGTVTLAPTGASGSRMAVIIQVDGTAYLKLNQGFLESLHVPASEFPVLNGKYIKSTSSSALADFSHLCDLPTLVSAFTQGGDTGLVKAGSTAVDGQPALAINQPSAAGEGTVYVSESAAPEILGLKVTGSDAGFLDFSKFNAPVAIAAPPAADIFSEPKSLQ